jgi:hypothetical protein
LPYRGFVAVSRVLTHDFKNNLNFLPRVVLWL